MVTKKIVTAPKGDAVAQKDLFTGTYTYAVGRRKTSVAQVRLYAVADNASRGHTVNGKKIEDFFGREEVRKGILAPLVTAGADQGIVVSAVVRGGGITGQADAIRHGIARALVASDEGHRPLLKAAGFLRRDPRAVERKKPGLKKARRATQWRKR